MHTDAAVPVGSPPGTTIPEGFLDALVTGLASKHNAASPGAVEAGRGRAGFANGRTGSCYIVKPKMHGSAEVAHNVRLFGRVEDALGLKTGTDAHFLHFPFFLPCLFLS